MKSQAIKIVEKLRLNGYETYLVGGCVRDMLMGEMPKDWDVATEATPEEVMELFDKTIPVGAKFGVVIVRLGRKNYEVATFREEWDYEDGRRPDQVRFSTAEADARRRDFTINAMFYDPVTEQVLDFVGGEEDLEAGLIRAVGDPAERFGEDKLRMLRAVRFAHRFGYEIEEETGKAIIEHASEIEQVSAERVREELTRMLAAAKPGDAIRMLDSYGLLEEILPEVKKMRGVEQPPEFHPEGDVFEHTMLMLDMAKPKYRKNAAFMMAVLLHDVGKPETFQVKDRIRFNFHASKGAETALKIMKRLRFSREDADLTAELVRDHLKFIDVQRMKKSTLKRFLRNENFDLHLELHRLDCKASHGKMKSYNFCKKELKELEKSPEVLRPDPLISGNDLIGLGLEPGPLFKEILTAVEDAQLEGDVTTREEALAMVKRMAAKKP